MNVWGISDLHLSFARPDRRERFAARWQDHTRKIEENWRAVVRPTDLVLLPGDFSMARNHRELQADLEWLGRLPGTKVLAQGNHDRWWNNVNAVRRLLRRSMIAVGGDATAIEGIIVCGTQGVPSPHEPPSADDQLAIDRDMEALGRALDHAARIRDNSDAPIYVLRHFPPFDANGRPGPWVEGFERAGVTACVYGHLHIQGQWSLAVQGLVRGVRYYCVAADSIGFRPLRVDGPSPG
ncbi:MAG: metallophosphoesterase [Isosphaeraceae bacterium]